MQERRHPQKQALVSPVREIGSRSASMTLGQYRNLASREPRRFEGLAFYQVVWTRAGAREISLALASENLFPLLGARAPRGRRAILVPPDSWQLPGRVEALLIDDNAIAALPDVAGSSNLGREVQFDTPWERPPQA